jgi:hypothetical protein
MTLTNLLRIRTGVLLLLCSLFSISSLFAQSQTINAVYAGTAYEYDQSSDAGSIQRTDYVYYFRPNGSFCSELDRPDWQKKVNGTYSIVGNQIRMKFLSDGAEKIILLSVTGETGQSGAATFVKLDVSNKVPAGFFKYVRSSGKQDGMRFADGGKFVHSVNTVTVSGNTAEDGKGKNDESGSYTIANSQLALKFDNGRTATYSFFTSQAKGNMAVINGNIYYLDEEDKTTIPANVASNNAVPGDKLDAGMNLLINANRTHGGKSLDALTTLKAVMTTNNLTLTLLVDYQGQKVRVTSALENNVILTEQLEGNSGWSYDGTGFATLSNERITELKRYLFCGLSGLRSDILGKSTATLQTQQAELSSIMVLYNNIRAGYIVNTKTNRLEALIMVDANNATTTVTYTDYKREGSLLLPYTEILQAGKHAQVITYKNYTVNPVLTSQDWVKPQ